MGIRLAFIATILHACPGDHDFAVVQVIHRDSPSREAVGKIVHASEPVLHDISHAGGKQKE